MLDLADNRENLESPHIIILTANPSFYITQKPFTAGYDGQYVSDNRTEEGVLIIQEGEHIK